MCGIAGHTICRRKGGATTELTAPFSTFRRSVHRFRLHIALACGVLVASAAALRAQRLTVHIEGVRTRGGSIHVGFYDSEAQWLTQRSSFQRHGTKAGLDAAGRVTLTFTDVPAGTYGLAVVDDANGSGGIDWGPLLPKEGFGFSNYYHRGLTRPKYERFAFELPAGESVEVTVRLRYL